MWNYQRWWIIRIGFAFQTEKITWANSGDKGFSNLEDKDDRIEWRLDHILEESEHQTEELILDGKIYRELV